MTELKANVEKWRKEHNKTKGNEPKEKVKNREEIKVLKEEVIHPHEAQTVTLSNEQDTSGGNKVLDHNMEERLEMKLTASAMKIHVLHTELVKLKDKQLEENVNQQTDSPLGLMVEKLAHLVEQ